MTDPRAALLLTCVIDSPAVLGTAAADARRPPSRMLLVNGSSKRVRVREDGSGSGTAAGTQDYPSSTDQWCWYCCHPFDGCPLPMPIKYDDRKDVYHVMGKFCSWACMKAFNSESCSYLKSVNANIITLFRKRCTKELNGIRSAPPRIALKVFGGSMSIAEFRAATDKPLEYCVLPPRMVTHHHAIQETDLAQLRLRARQHHAPPDLKAVVDFKDVSTKNETLRLKRPKPLQNNRNLLERTMGIGALGTCN